MKSRCPIHLAAHGISVVTRSASPHIKSPKIQRTTQEEMIGDAYLHIVTDCTQQSGLKAKLECLFRDRKFFYKLILKSAFSLFSISLPPLRYLIIFLYKLILTYISLQVSDYIVLQSINNFSR